MDSDLADDWMFNSMKKYGSLFMYELQQTITDCDWTSSQGFCVAITDGKKHEILELSLPDKLLINEHQSGLCKDRDFRVENGGFINERIVHMSHVPNTRYIITSTDQDNSIHVLQVGGEELNLICKKRTIKNQELKNSSVIGVLSESHVLFGNKINNLSLADINTGTIISGISETDQSITSLSTIDEFTCLACERSRGEIYTIDARDRKLICNLSNSNNTCDSHWTMCVSHDQKYVYQISSDGKIRQEDRRNTLQDITMTTSLLTNKNSMCITCSPSNEYLAVSGFDGNIYIYSTRDFKHEKAIESVFKHEGHVANTSQSEPLLSTVHMWHPSQSEIILSGASDGSLHTWQPVLS